MNLIRIEDGLWGNVDLYFSPDIPFNPYPGKEFKVTLCKSVSGYQYYFKYNGFLGHEPATISKKFNDEFGGYYNAYGTKEKMIERMCDFLQWVKDESDIMNKDTKDLCNF